MKRIFLKRRAAILLTFVGLLCFYEFFYGWDYPSDADRVAVKKYEEARKLYRSFQEASNFTTESGMLMWRQAPIRPTLDSVRQNSDTNKYPIPYLPGLYSYLPHIASNPDLLVPHHSLSGGRSGVKFVIGIPSIKRPVGVYVFDTLTSLITGMNERDKEEVLIILCITEPWDVDYELKVIEELKVRFPTELSSGLLDVITPKAGYYPDFSTLKPTLGDKLSRVKWRSKQNLDYVYLMMHAWSRGVYYIQLEDDVQAVPDYISSMKSTISKTYGEWFALEFSYLGFIGRLFKSDDVLKIMEFLLMFYSQKPCDWLYDDYLRVRMCGHGEPWPKCKSKIRTVARPVTPSLFQHKGERSSLGGTKNKLRDKFYGGNGTNVVVNPPVKTIITTMNTYGQNSIYNAYDGSGIFWASSPTESDIIDFVFLVPLHLKRIQIKTGSKTHSTDIFRNTTLEVLPQLMPDLVSPLAQKQVLKFLKRSPQDKIAMELRLREIPELENVAHNNIFFKVGDFDMEGRADVSVPEEFGPVWVLRLHTLSNSSTWVIISTITIETR